MPVEPNQDILSIEKRFMKDIGLPEINRVHPIMHPASPPVVPTKQTPRHPPTDCCGYSAELDNSYPVFWNPHNKVVQCHSCGHTYEPCSIKVAEVPQTCKEDVLEEALRITSGDRQNQYGPPDQDFARTAGMWTALFGYKLSAPFEPRDVAMAMICLKLSRETHQRKRDNAVDGAGYFRCLHLCNQASSNGE